MGILHITQEEAVNKVQLKCLEKQYKFKTFVYTGTKTYIELICYCGHEWKTKYDKFVNGNRGCPNCNGGVKLTQQAAESNVKQKCIEKKYTYKNFVYTNNNTKIVLNCHCGYTWEASYRSLVKNNSGCPKCAGRATITQKDAEYNVKEKCLEYNYTFGTFVYKNNKTKIPLTCHCGYKWYVSYSNFIHSGTICPKCNGGIKLKQEEAEYNVQKKCIERNYISKSFVYINNITKISLICNYGHEWLSAYNDFVIGNNGCPYCAGKNQKYAYIHSIMDGDIPISLKYGIETISNHRHKKQNRKSVYIVKPLLLFYFESVNDCKSAEKECIKLFQKENKELFGRKGYITKEEMRDGWTETTSVSNIEKIISIYEKWGGIKQ